MTLLAGTPEWLAARRNGIGASEVGALFGCDPYRTQLELYAMKVGELADEETEEMRMGWLLEPFLLERFAESGQAHECGPAQAMVRDAEAPHLFATPDGWYNLRPHPSATSHMLETKATSEPEPPDGPPLRWVLQVQTQLACTGAQHGKIAALYQSTRFRIHDVPRREDVISAIRERVESWWWRHVRRRQPPRDPAQPLPIDILRALYPCEEPGRTVVLPPEATAWDDRIREIKGQVRRLEYERRELEAWIAEHIGSAESGVVPDRAGRWSWRTVHTDGYEVAARDVRTLRRLVK